MCIRYSPFPLPIRYTEKAQFGLNGRRTMAKACAMGKGESRGDVYKRQIHGWIRRKARLQGMDIGRHILKAFLDCIKS